MGGKILPLSEATRKLCRRSFGKVQNVCLFSGISIVKGLALSKMYSVIPAVVVISALSVITFACITLSIR